MDAFLAPLGITPGELLSLLGLALVLLVGLGLLRALMRMTARLLRFGCTFVIGVMLLALLVVVLN